MSQPFPVQSWSTHARRRLLPCPGTHRQQLALLQHGRIQADELNPRRLLKSRQFMLAAICSAAKVYCKVIAGGSKATCCHILCCCPHHALGLRRPPAHARSEISRKQAARDGIAEGAEARAALSEPLFHCAGLHSPVDKKGNARQLLAGAGLQRHGLKHAMRLAATKKAVLVASLYVQSRPGGAGQWARVGKVSQMSLSAANTLCFR